MKNKNKIICIILLAVFVVQIFLANVVIVTYNNFKNNQITMVEEKAQATSTVVMEIVSNQQKNQLQAIKQSWVKYLNNNPDINLIEKQDGLQIFSNGTEELKFDPENMVKVISKDNSYYNIYNLNGEAILLKCRPKWNYDKVYKVIDTLIGSQKNFGNNGGMIVYDSNSGQILLDTTSQQRLSKSKNASIFNDDVSIYDLNKSYTHQLITNHLMHKKDTTVSNCLISLFNEDRIKGNPYDFNKYPLGQYKRQFLDVVTLPYETVGFYGEPLQLTILSVADEQDILKNYYIHSTKINQSFIINEKLYERLSMVLFISIITMMLLMTITLYFIKRDDNQKQQK